MTQRKSYRQMYEASQAELERKNKVLSVAYDLVEASERQIESQKSLIAITEKKLLEYEKKISEFKQLKWYQKLNYKF